MERILSEKREKRAERAEEGWSFPGPDLIKEGRICNFLELVSEWVELKTRYSAKALLRVLHPLQPLGERTLYGRRDEGALLIKTVLLCSALPCAHPGPTLSAETAGQPCSPRTPLQMPSTPFSKAPLSQAVISSLWPPDGSLSH